MSTIEPVAQAAFLTNAVGTVTTWNDACADLFGVSPVQILGHAMGSLLSGRAAQECAQRWREMPLRRQANTIALDLQRADGRSFNAALTLAPQFDQAGAFRGCVAAVISGREHDASESLQVGHTPLSAIVDTFPGTFYAINQQGRLVLWNHNLERVLEMTPDELAAANVLDMFHLPERPRIRESMRKVFEEGAEVKIEALYVSKSGRELPFLLGGTRIKCNGGTYLFGMGIDMSDRREQDKQLRLRERALHAASNGIVIARREGKDHPIEYVNPAFERITGYTQDEVIGRDCRFMAAPGLDANERAQVRDAVAERRQVNVVFRNRRKNGDLFWNDLTITPVLDESGEVTHFIGVIIDVTASKQRTAYLEHEVNHDALTGLANRNLLWDRLEHALHLAQRHKSLVATVLIDLNNFKAINDTFGHEAGDLVLKAVAKRLQASVRDSDTVARLSGDEFVLVLVNQPSLRFTLRMIERLRQSLTTPVSFNAREIPVGASIGVSVFPHDGATVVELVRAADVAMYHAKATGQSEIYFFSADMKSTTEAKQRLESGMREALERDELFLVYQPRVHMGTGRVTGLEALLRWRHPEHGLMLPPSFLAEAEENGLIVQIGSRVLDQACAFLQKLRKHGVAGVPVAVNASHKEYSHRNFMTGIADRLLKFSLPNDSLEIEIREAGLIRHPDLGREMAGQMRELGMGLSIDGFGEGMSDLGYLRQLPVTHLKLAKGAVHAIASDRRGNAMAKTLIDIGRNLNIQVVGEAVETLAQVDFLKSHGCDEVQGVYFSAPLPADTVQQMLQTRQPA